MIVFVDVLGLGITIPVLPLFAQNQLGADAWQITTLTSVYFIAQFIASPLLGRLSDQIGRRPVLILSQTGTLAALLLNATAPGLGFLYLSRIVDGFTGGNVSVAQAYLTDITDQAHRARGLGLISAAFGLGFIIGPAFGGLMAAAYGPRVPFFVAAGMSCITILLSVFLLPESLTPERRRAHAALVNVRRFGSLALLQNRTVAVVLVLTFGIQFAFFTYQTIYVLWMSTVILPGAPQAQVTQTVGWLLAFRGIFGVLTQVSLVGPAARRFGESRLVVLGLGADLLGYAFIALIPGIPSVILNAPLLAIGGGLAIPAMIALLTFAAPARAHGQAIGLSQSISALGSILGPLLAGFLYTSVSYNAPMVATTVIITLTFLVSLLLLRVPRHQAASPL